MDPAPPAPLLRIAVIGAGDHSRRFHLPALAHFREHHPGIVALVAIVDPNLSVAIEAAAQFGFERSYTSSDDMLALSRPDACLVLTPIELNATVAIQIARLGLPLLMEKPPGATIDEARRLVAELAALRARVMVSMNRRFDPLLRAATDWIGSRPIRHVNARMVRLARTEPNFVEHTGLHVVDVVRAIGGEVASSVTRRQKDGRSDCFQGALKFASGATGRIDLMPTAGMRSESIEILGDHFHVEIRSAEFDRGSWRAWTDGGLECDHVLPQAIPMFIANGTYAETEAFIHALQKKTKLFPAPSDVLPSMELCHSIAEAPESAIALP